MILYFLLLIRLLRCLCQNCESEVNLKTKGETRKVVKEIGSVDIGTVTSLHFFEKIEGLALLPPIILHKATISF